MTLESTFPWLWAFLIAALLLLSWRQRRPDRPSARVYVSLTLRAVLGLCLLLAYANPVHTFTRFGQQCILFLVDQSDSISEAGRRRALDFMRAVNALKGEDNTAGLITFAGQVEVTSPPAPNFDVRRPAVIARTDGTDITGALEAGLRTFPSESIRTIVLLSDGNETARNARGLIESARQQEVQIHTVPLERNTGLAWGIEKLFAPRILLFVLRHKSLILLVFLNMGVLLWFWSVSTQKQMFWDSMVGRTLFSLVSRTGHCVFGEEEETTPIHGFLGVDR